MAELISSSEFRKNMATYLDKADENENILVVRKSNVLYSLVKVNALAPDADFDRAITGDDFEKRTIELLQDKISEQ